MAQKTLKINIFPVFSLHIREFGTKTNSILLSKLHTPFFSFALYAIFPVRVISRRGFSFVQLIAGPFVWIFPFYGVLYNFMLSCCWGSCLSEEDFFLFTPVRRMDR